MITQLKEVYAKYKEPVVAKIKSAFSSKHIIVTLVGIGVISAEFGFKFIDPFVRLYFICLLLAAL